MELIVVLAALFGLAIGSFINAAVYRLAQKESLLVGRSHCVHCRYQLRWHDLIPVGSFLVLRGRCRECRKSIPADYVFVELACGLLFAYVAWRWLQLPEPFIVVSVLTFVRDLLASSVLLFLFVYDLKYMTLPDRVTLPALVLVIILSLLLGMSWQILSLGILIGGGFFLLQYLLSKGKWIGGGDIRLGALIGALLGWPLILVALFLAYVFGAVTALTLLFSGKKMMGDSVAFGTFLSVACLITLWWGQPILQWYVAFL